MHCWSCTTDVTYWETFTAMRTLQNFTKAMKFLNLTLPGKIYSTLSTPCTPFDKNKYNNYSTTVDIPNTSLEVFSFSEALQPWCSTLTFSKLNCSVREFITPALFSWLSWDLLSLHHKERSYLLITMWLQHSVNITPCQNCIAQVEQEVGYYVLPRYRKIVWVCLNVQHLLHRTAVIDHAASQNIQLLWFSNW